MRLAYAIHCTRQGCERLAAFKIAARWSDGVTEELKTYALVCEPCLPAAFRDSVAKNTACLRAKNERLEKPGIYRMAAGRRDQQLDRCIDLEVRLVSE
jgi:hypothetical protein